jgi:hypothetical protein
MMIFNGIKNSVLDNSFGRSPHRSNLAPHKFLFMCWEAGAFASEAGAFASEAGAFAPEAGASVPEAGAFVTEAGAFASEAGAFGTEAGAFGMETGMGGMRIWRVADSAIYMCVSNLVLI